MTADLDDQLAEYWSRCCEGKARWSPAGARNSAVRMRAEGLHVEAYACPFGDHNHVGSPLSMHQLAIVAGLLRRRNGGTPVQPGSGTTRRQRRKDRHGATS